MKKFTKVLSTVLAVMMTVGSISAMSLSASAAEKNEITVTSNVTAPVSYSYSADSTQFTVSYMLKSDYKVINAQAEVSYDSSVLKLVDTTTEKTISPVLSKKNYAGNIDLDNKIKFNSTSVSLYNFTTEAAFFTATFDIVGKGSTNVNLNIDVLTGTTATTGNQLATATDVPFVNLSTVDSSKFTMTASGEVTTPDTGDVTIKLAAPVTTINGYNWKSASLYYGSSATFASETFVEMKATDEVFYASEVGDTASSLLKADAWQIYSITLTDEQVAAIDDAKIAGFTTTDKKSRTAFGNARNVFKAAVDEFAATYGTTKASVADLNGHTFIIKDATSAANVYTSYIGNWVSDFTTVKFAAPASNVLRSTWNAVDFFYGPTAGTATTVSMVNTYETTKIDDIGDMSTLKVGRWYIYAVSLDPVQTATANASKSVGFRKPGDTNTTSGSRSVLLAKTDEYDGKYNTTARTLEELEGQVFVVQGKASATSLLTFLGEWQTEAKYTEGKDDTITINFAAPKGTSDTNSWTTGVQLYYGKTTNYKDVTKVDMTKTGRTTSVDVSGTALTTLESGKWDIYTITLTADDISKIDNSNNVGFIKTDSYNRTSILQTKNITRASRLEGETAYTSAAETIQAFDGMTFIINGCQDAKNERTSYLGSWVLI